MIWFPLSMRDAVYWTSWGVCCSPFAQRIMISYLYIQQIGRVFFTAHLDIPDVPDECLESQCKVKFPKLPRIPPKSSPKNSLKNSWSKAPAFVRSNGVSWQIITRIHLTWRDQDTDHTCDRIELLLFPITRIHCYGIVGLGFPNSSALRIRFYLPLRIRHFPDVQSYETWVEEIFVFHRSESIGKSKGKLDS